MEISFRQNALCDRDLFSGPKARQITMTETNRLPDLWTEPPESEEEAAERVDVIRGYINEEVGDVKDGQEMRRTLARLYTEWALEHIQDLREFDRENNPRYRYAEQAETDLKNIILRL